MPPTIRFVAIVTADRVLECHVCAAKEPDKVCHLVCGRIAAEPVGEALVVGVAACGVFALRGRSMIARECSSRFRAVA